MKIAFHGAARTVTGSKHLLTLKNGNKYLLDCGLFQGKGKETDPMNRHWGFEPASVKAVILSHAHIDHCGLLPKLVKDGFSGKIYCTPATQHLAAILLEDSAGIQEDDVKYSNKHRAAEGRSRRAAGERQRSTRALRARQRRRFRHAGQRSAVRSLSAPARGERVRGFGRGPGDVEPDHSPPRWPDLGGSGARQGSDSVLHARN